MTEAKDYLDFLEQHRLMDDAQKYPLAVEYARSCEAEIARLRAALTEQGLLQKKPGGGMVWHAHDCPASFDFAQCNYRCRVAREAFAIAGTEPYVSQETRAESEVYE